MATKKTTASQAEVIQIKPVVKKKVKIRFVGDSPLITHAWSEKAKKEIRDKQTGTKKVGKREPKNPTEDFIVAAYWLTPMPEEKTIEAFNKAVDKGAKFGVKAVSFKEAAISAAYRKGWTKDKVSIRGEFHIRDLNGGTEFLEIHSDKPIMREDPVRVGMGTADLRYRPEYDNWYCDAILSYDVNSNYSLEDILNMLNAGGYAVGCSEWRCEKSGTFGQFHVESVK